MPLGTVHAVVPFSAKSDAATLRKAMKGLGTDEKALVDVLCHRSAEQRQQIATVFKAEYGKDLDSQLKSELSGDFERVLLSLMKPLANYLAEELHGAMAGIGTKEKVLVEILCTRTNAEMRQIADAYEKLYSHKIEKDIKGDTSGVFETLLLALLKAERDESDSIDMVDVKTDTARLYFAGEGQIGTDALKFVHVLATKSYAHIRQMRVEYEKARGHDLKKAIKKEFSGVTKTAMLAILQCADNKAEYFAKRLHKSMVGLGTRENDLTRVLVSRCEIDLANIRKEYETHFKKPLAKAVASETSGDYKMALLALIG